jgi:NAD+ synthase (glutamine-hydrolysing)
MNTLRLALAQFDFLVGDLVGNSEKILALIEQAKLKKADLILFPELALSGYPPEDLLLRPGFLRNCEQALQNIALQVHGITVVLPTPRAIGSVVFNSACVIQDAVIQTCYHKQELPNYAVFDERRYFASDSDACTFVVNGVTVGLIICEDLWFAEPIAQSVKAGAQLVLVPNASPFEHGKTVQRDALLSQRVKETKTAIAYLNAVGGQDEVVFDGSSVLADADGLIHTNAECFKEQLLLADFNATTGKFCKIEWAAESDESFESLAYRAMLRGIKDYCGKNSFSKVLLGLSGGVDSALVLALAVDALGAENVLAVRLPSRYTSGMSNDLADVQAKALGVSIETIAIEAPFEGFLTALSDTFEGLPSDVTEENLQSRCRGVLLMALANKKGGLLLTTGNKSEYAVGYATIYGDMCGGYAPIKDLYKTEVYRVCEWRNQQGDGEVIPQPVIDRPPSAELRENQVDQDSLPPYEILDAIMKAYIDQEKSSAEIIENVSKRWPDIVDIDKVILRMLRLLKISEWKRRQAAPGPKLSRRAFGRERRYPITSGYRG